MSLRNPKHKFSASITFEKHVEGIGQSVTITADTLRELQALAKEYRKFNSHVLIKENKAEYPKFNWVEVKEYNLSEPEKEHREKIGSRLRELREDAGLTVRDLALKAGVTPANVTNIEYGRYSVGLDVLVRIASVLGASVEIEKAAE